VKAGDLKALLEAQGFTPDNGLSTHLLAAVESAHIPLSYALALVEKESQFQNIYGHDAVRNPIKSPPGGVRRVTLVSYRAYKAYRRRGWGCQGVGPVQLTYFTLQDEADRIGGCHKPYPNMTVGFRLAASGLAAGTWVVSVAGTACAYVRRGSTTPPRGGGFTTRARRAHASGSARLE
jgi:hypothetical protein